MHKICEICKKVPATVHLTDIKNNVKTEVHMCESCAAKKGIDIKKPMLLQQLFGDKFAAITPALGSSKAENHIVCPYCGLSWDGFQKNGRFGCARDYEVFAKNLQPLLNELHASPGQHIGKSPRPSPRCEAQRHKLEYQRLLREAIAKEDYQEAARLRDSISALEG